MISIKNNKDFPRENTDKILTVNNVTLIILSTLDCICFQLVSHNKVSVGIICVLCLVNWTLSCSKPQCLLNWKLDVNFCIRVFPLPPRRVHGPEFLSLPFVDGKKLISPIFRVYHKHHHQHQQTSLSWKSSICFWLLSRFGFSFHATLLYQFALFVTSLLPPLVLWAHMIYTRVTPVLSQIIPLTLPLCFNAQRHNVAQWHRW